MPRRRSTEYTKGIIPILVVVFAMITSAAAGTGYVVTQKYGPQIQATVIRPILRAIGVPTIDTRIPMLAGPIPRLDTRIPMLNGPIPRLDTRIPQPTPDNTTYIAGEGVFPYRYRVPVSTPRPSPSVVIAERPPGNPTAEWTTVTNNDAGLSVEVPVGWSVSTVTDPSTGRETTITDPARTVTVTVQATIDAAVTSEAAARSVLQRRESMLRGDPRLTIADFASRIEGTVAAYIAVGTESSGSIRTFEERMLLGTTTGRTLIFRGTANQDLPDGRATIERIIESFRVF